MSHLDVARGTDNFTEVAMIMILVMEASLLSSEKRHNNRALRKSLLSVCDMVWSDER